MPQSAVRSLLLATLLGATLGAAATRWAVPEAAAAQAASTGARYVAVAAEYQSGVSLLYVLDQQTEHLAVYEARGGASNSRELVLVGARNISLDTQLEGFNDESDYSFRELRDLFERRKIPTGQVDEKQEGG